MILDTILASVRRDLPGRKQRQPPAQLYQLIERQPAAGSFQTALAVPGRVRLIAEYKRASPSKGIIREDLPVAAVTAAYAAGGAAAVSILTEPHYFKGSLDYLAEARQAAAIPLLRKDFIIDEYQLLEARAYGAAAVLLIVAALPAAQLAFLLRRAAELSLDCLVEVHNRGELAVALAAGAVLIGINNRDLATFETRLETTLELAPHIPAGKLLVSESGINSRRDIERLAACGVNAVLVGEALMRSPDPGRKLRELAGESY
ncbi:MAG: indole-3-glycerol phosphate synthase TrpC [Sporomusaceae bacterium]|nr:indole-3-glycerol phosphate synthase TrpC [Sporomusaceae bacterium]